MKFKTILTFITLIIAASSVKAQNEGFAVGAQLFSQTGISVKATISKSAAITGAVGFNINEFNNSFSVQTNLILNGDEDTFTVESGLLRFYYGIGLNFLISENTDNGIGIRLPLGIEYTLQD